MSTQSSMLHVRVDEDTKNKATAALGAMGLSVSEAVRLFLSRVIQDQAFPLELKVPNAATRAAMAEAEDLIQTGAARFANAEALFADLEDSARR